MPLNIVMFELAKAQGYIASKDWKGLENYVSTFLIEVQGDKFHPHPGIICSISQARISYLIEREQFDEAIAVFNDIVRPLTDQEDDLFKPLDLKTRVDMLERCVEHRLLPPTQLKENLDRAIGDYVTLYFPSSVRDVPTKRTIQDFICTFNAGTECRCLACGSPLPKEDSAHEIIYHINHEKREQPCPRATRWLREQLAKIKGTTGHASKKRRVLEGPPQVSGSAADEDQECIAIPAGPAYECLGRLVCANMKAYSALSFCKSKSAKRASEIVEQQEMVLDTVRYKVAQAMKDNLLLDAEMLSKVKVVYDLQFSMFPLLNSLGSAYTTMLDLHDKICDMMRHCMQASALHGQSNPFSPLPCAATNTEQTAALSASGSNGSRPTAEQTPAFSDSWSST